jgi:apolipoprotein N-acyltransferase
LAFLISGLLLVLPFSLLNLEWVVWFALVPLFLATLRVSARDSFVLGYLCGVVWNTGSLFWMHVYAPLALPLVVLILSFYPALFCLGLNKFIGKRNPAVLLWAAPLLWVSLEYVRSLGFLGFPWNSLGYSQYGQISVIQMAEFTGVYGVSFLIVFVNSGIASVIEAGLPRPYGSGGVKPPLRSFINEATTKTGCCAFRVVAIVCVVLGLWLSWGNYALKKFSREEGEPLRAALVQGNFGTDCYWEDNSPDIMRCLSALSLGTAVSGPDLIIWSETAIGENPETAFAVDSRLKREISHILKETGAYLVAGAHYDCGGKAYNSVFLVSPECEVVDRYDKMHLVPAAEYFPFWRYTRLVEYLLRDAGDFTPGVRRTIFEIPGGGKFAALICFEGIFGDFTRRFVKDGAEFLVNITNDVWSRSETSHHQHAAIASFRAVENRVYLLRLGNSGISRVINPYGIIEKELGVYESGVLMGEVFPRTGQTFYTRHGDVFAKVVLVITSLLFFLNFPFGRRLRPF